MRIVRRLRGSDYIGYYILEDNESLKEQEIENLEERQGYYIETYYDKEEDIIKQRYIEIAKSETEILKEELEKINKALEDLILQNAML